MQYTIPTPTTTDTEDMGNGRRLVRDEWKDGDYTLVRETFHGKTGVLAPRWNATADSHELPGIYDMNLYKDKGPVFGINWNAMGTRSIEETEAYAHTLLHATETAKRFNAIVEACS